MQIRPLRAAAFAGSVMLVLASCGGDGAPGARSAADRARLTEAPRPLAQIARLRGRATTIALDGGFVASLAALRLRPAASGEATLTPDGTARLPVTGGIVTVYRPGTVAPSVQGEIHHAGSGLRLTGAGRRVVLADLVLDPGRALMSGTASVDGRVVGRAVRLLHVDGRTQRPMHRDPDGTVVMDGALVTLTREAAQLLNATFAIAGLRPGAVVGVATMSLQ